MSVCSHTLYNYYRKILFLSIKSPTFILRQHVPSLWVNSLSLYTCVGEKFPHPHICILNARLYNSKCISEWDALSFCSAFSPHSYKIEFVGQSLTVYKILNTHHIHFIIRNIIQTFSFKSTVDTWSHPSVIVWHVKLLPPVIV